MRRDDRFVVIAILFSLTFLAGYTLKSVVEAIAKVPANSQDKPLGDVEIIKITITKK